MRVGNTPLALLLAGALGLGASAPASAQAYLMEDCARPQQRTLTPAEKEAQSFQQSRVQGRDLKKAVDTVRKSLTWHDDLEEAIEVAENQDRPILWIHALGDLDGDL